MPGPGFFAGFVVALNVIAFGAMGADKASATRRRRRIPERTLLLLALPLAAPRAWVGMLVFRHKTRKRSFQVQMALVTLVQVAAAAWWLSA